MLAVAITGGIGAGKSTALDAFRAHGAATVSSDEIVHHLLATDDGVRDALVERLVPEIWGRSLAMNVSGAIAAVLLDAGYPLLAVKGVPMLARTASLIAHLTEEQQRPIGFVIADEGASAIGYDGQKPDGFEPGQS